MYCLMNKQLKGIKVERIVHFLTCTILFCIFQELIQKFGTGKEQYLQYILTKSVIKAKINILNTPYSFPHCWNISANWQAHPMTWPYHL